MDRTPFAQVLPLDTLAAPVAAHLGETGQQRFTGTIVVHARGIVGRILAAWPLGLAHSEAPVSALLENFVDGDEMVWRRTVRGRTSEGRFRKRAETLVDRTGGLDVSFRAASVGGALELRSFATHFCVGWLRVRIPSPRATIREEAMSNGLRITLALTAPLFGELLRYEAALVRVRYSRAQVSRVYRHAWPL